jgi:methionine-rich copper-binding protein CopC
MRAVAPIAASLCLYATASANVLAHVSLDQSVPAAGSVMRGSPPEVRLRFTSKIEAALSTIKVLDSRGRQVDKGDAQVDRSGPALLRISLAPLAPGTYRVTWRVVSTDMHVISGEFDFAVQP